MTPNLTSLADARLHARAAACGGCQKQGTLSAHEVRKDGPNQGRLFMKCGRCGHFAWLSPARAGEQPPPPPHPPARPKKEPPRPLTEPQRTEAGLLADIRDDPEDDAPRLIYADWLDEHGLAARAELIRVQIQRARLPSDAAAWAALRRREQELLAAHEEEWLAPIAKLAVGHEFIRGLLDDVLTDAETFCQNAELLLNAAPTAAWIISAEDYVAVRAVVRCEHFPRLRRLALRGRMGGAGARILAESRHVACLRELEVRGNSLGQPGVQALAGSAYLGDLRALGLRDNNLSRSCVPILASSTNLPVLRKLDLSRNLLGNSDARSIATAKHWPQLRELDLSGNAIDNEGAEALAASPLLRQLVRLDLCDTGVSAIGARKILQSPHARRELWVGHGRRG
jgi:uncharacterized protein (TIGR02996 family)